MLDWQAKDQQHAFEEWKGQVTLALLASSINREVWFVRIVGFLGKKGFKLWNTLPISKDEESQKNPKAVFKAIIDALEVLTLSWNHIDKMYSDIRQGEQETTDQLDQHIKDLVERCQFQTEAEKMVVGQSCFFMQQNILKSKSGSDQRRLMRSRHSSFKKVMAIEPRVA